MRQNMRQTIAATSRITLGKQGENEANKVIFPVGEYEKIYGEGSFALVHRREGDTDFYPCAIETIKDCFGCRVEWVIHNSDVANAGEGEAELRYLDGNGKIAKSDTFKTVVKPGAESETTEPPEPVEYWLDQASTYAVRAENASDTATEKANIAIAAKDDAIEARDSAIEAAENARSEVTEAFGEITASATTLEAGQSATASFDPSSKVMSFGIPRGEKGNEGAHGVPGAVVSNTEPTDPDIAVWVKPDGTVEPFDYEELKNLPKINYIPIKGNVTLWQLGVTKRGYLFTPNGEVPVTTKTITVNGETMQVIVVDEEVD